MIGKPNQDQKVAFKKNKTISAVDDYNLPHCCFVEQQYWTKMSAMSASDWANMHGSFRTVYCI